MLNWKPIFTESLSYKIISLIIAFILWLTILGRRDFVLSKNIELEFVVSPQYRVISQSAEFIKVRVSGPRTALKKFMDSSISPVVNLDISTKGIGKFSVEIPQQKIDVPFGVKVVSIRPASVIVQIEKENQ